MSISTAKANLQDATKKLMAEWQRVAAQWDDATSKQFAKEVIDPILPRINAAMKGIDHVGELVGKVRRECGD